MDSHAERLARIDPKKLDPETLWFRMLATKQVIEEFETARDAGPVDVAHFVYDLKLALNGDILQDQISGGLMRFQPGQGQLLSALIGSDKALADDIEDGGE